MLPHEYSLFTQLNKPIELNKISEQKTAFYNKTKNIYNKYNEKKKQN